MSFLSNFFIIFTLYFCNFFVLGQDVPPSPCPDIFQYYQQSNGNIYGRITIPHDGNTVLNLSVNASMKGYYTDRRTVNLKIKMLTPGQDLIEQRARSLTYSVTFPFQHTIPKITSIALNNRRYCSGPPEELIPGAPGVTGLWAGHTFFFQTEIKNGVPTQLGPEVADNDVGEPVTPNKGFSSINFLPPSTEQRFDNNRKPSSPSRNRYQECGIPKVSSIQLILGGTDVSDGKFPWLGAIFSSQGVQYDYRCTGNLVTERHVITAARCMFYYRLQTVQTEDLLFIFGKSNLRNWATSGAVTRGASQLYPHPDFNQESGHADVLIATLDRPLQFSSTISPICLWPGDSNLANIVYRRGTVAGWGSNNRNPNPDQYSVLIAQSLDIPVVPNDECLSSNLSYYSLTSDKTFCAGRRDGTGTCIGDVGGGFMMTNKERFYLRGLASIPLINSKGECDTSFYMVFCDVAQFTNWIKTNIK